MASHGTRIRSRWVLLGTIVAVLLAAGVVAGFELTAGDQPRAAAPVSSSALPTATVTSSSPVASTKRKPAPTPTPTPTPTPSSSTPARQVPATSRAVIPPAPTSTAPAGPVPTPPVWLPIRAAVKVGCVKSNCENNYHGYWAIDFETLDNKPGAPVYAAGSGRIRIGSQGAGKCGGPGTVANSLIIDHGNGVESVYVHLIDFAVPSGSWVTPNTIIGHIGSSGYTDPCPDYHLHFEVRVNGASVNPGELKACHGAGLVSYPSSVGYTDWNVIVAQEYAGGPVSPKGRTVYSDGTSCG
jgi:murein DD-endopeptidase MepM/ murein hydrolase activator NlpD